MFPDASSLKKVILVVEDNAQVRSVISKALKLENYVTQQAKNGHKALEILKTIRPDLILSDINMPIMDGLEFNKRLSQKPQWSAIPFIFLTSNDAPEDIQRGRELGIEDYLTKPIESDELVRIIDARLYRSTEIKIAHIGQAYLDTVDTLANAIEERDKFTSGHVKRVTTYSLWMGKALNWPHQHLRALKFGAMLHDIGKIAIPDQVLNKTHSLTSAEWETMKKHPLLGAKILQGVSHLRDAIPYILYHHERWDGSGYPKGLSGKGIPVQGRVLALADSYDALTTTRSYHPARPHDEVIEFIKMKAGEYFDPQLVPIFIKIMNTHKQNSS
ncbi:MAG: response regulator [Chloroflexota bacterium]|nr:response regulator [Chloroflexota bacterium]